MPLHAIYIEERELPTLYKILQDEASYPGDSPWKRTALRVSRQLKDVGNMPATMEEESCEPNALLAERYRNERGNHIPYQTPMPTAPIDLTLAKADLHSQIRTTKPSPKF